MDSETNVNSEITGKKRVDDYTYLKVIDTFKYFYVY